MNLALEVLAYKEERLLPKFIQSMQDRVNEIVVLSSTKPWQGVGNGEKDKTAAIARSLGCAVIEYDWADETSQRNAGVDYCSDFDWLIVLDPDEFISNEDWDKFMECLEKAEAPAYIVEHQRVFWKHEEVFPHSDYQQLIALKPKQVRFVDKRVVNSVYGLAPVDLLHFSWARTDEEVLSKISHYSHANELIPDWYENVWKKNRRTNLHPKDPEVLAGLIPAVLPLEIQRLDLWPT
jgi:glycosyltransferase involved in cell wall biosynthesis